MDGTGITLSGLSNDMHKEVKNRRNLLIWVKLLRDEGISFNNMAKNSLVTKLSSRKDLRRTSKWGSAKLEVFISERCSSSFLRPGSQM